MGAFADLSEFVNRMTGGNSGSPESMFYHKETRVAGGAAGATIAGRWTSFWQYEGFPAHGSVPTTVAAPDNTTAGSLLHTAPGGGRQKWLPSVWMNCSLAGTLVVYDRLLHIGSLSGTVTTAQAVGGSLTRNTTGVGNQIWAEVYSAVGTTATTITAIYENQSGVAAQVTQAVPFGGVNLNSVQRMIPLSLAAGDYGVRSVTSCTLAASTTTAGNFGIVVLKPVAVIGIAITSVGTVRTFLDGGLPDISTSCLSVMFLPNAGGNAVVDGFFNMVER